MIEVSPSLLSADFANLQRDVEMLNNSGATYIHCDIMDGIFVPNISFGFPVMKAVARHAKLPLDAHLMIADPGRYVAETAAAGATIMTVHYEACTHLHRVVGAIHDAGMKAGVSLNPATPVELLRDILPDLDLVLIMSVNPGFAAQKFIRGALDKVKRLRALITETGSHAKIEVDGGVNLNTGAELAAAGADILVAGNYVFGAQDPAAAVAALSNLG